MLITRELRQCGAEPGEIPALAFQGGVVMRAIVYIDGFNLYYGLLRHSPHKWLNLEKFVKALLTDKYEVMAIKYFTARVTKDADDPDAAIKQ